MGIIRVVMGKVEKIREWEESNAGGCNNTASFLGGRCGAGWEVTVIGVMLVGGSNNAHQRIVRLMAGGGGGHDVLVGAGKLLGRGRAEVEMIAIEMGEPLSVG